MDEVDRAIVTHLQQDARQTNRELARKLGIAPSTCLERVRALRERGVITGYHAEISLTALNRHAQALIHIRIRPQSRAAIEEVRAFVAAQPEVVSVYAVAGDDDLIAHVAAPGVDDLYAFGVDRLGERGEIAGFHSTVIFEHARKRVIDPL